MEKINLKVDGEAREMTADQVQELIYGNEEELIKMRNDAKFWYDEYTKMNVKYKTACQAIRAITDAAIAISNPYDKEM